MRDERGIEPTVFVLNYPAVLSEGKLKLLTIVKSFSRPSFRQYVDKFTQNIYSVEHSLRHLSIYSMSYATYYSFVEALIHLFNELCNLLFIR
jgi:hypothetical protein